MKTVRKTVLSFAAAVLCFACAAAARTDTANASTYASLWYEPSDQYKTSEFYESFKAVELTGDQRTDMVNIVLSQVGYHEGDVQGQTSGNYPNGKKDVTEYTYWFGREIKGWSNGFNYAWCAIFVSWCARAAGVSTSVIPNATYACPLNKSYCFNIKYYEKGNNGFTYTPKPGDLVFFSWDADNPAWSHVEIVVDYIDGYLFTVGGNARNGVNRRAYAIDEPCIRAYGVPNYTEVQSSEHDYGEWTVVKAPDCEHTGVKQRICKDCNKVETAEIPALGHQYYHWGNTEDEWIVDIPATETTDGEKSQHCLRCGNRYMITPIYASSTHHYSESWTVDTEPTCTECGEKSHHCTDFGCNARSSITQIAPLGHSYGEYIIDEEPTCTETGSKHRICTRDGCTATDVASISALGHDFGAFVTDKEPTCTETGEKSRHCERDGCTEKTEITTIDALGHDFSGEWVIDKEPTCTEAGERSHICTREGCNERGDIEETEPLSHDYILESVEEATCTKTGIRKYVCQNDSEHTYEEIIDVLPHTESDWIVTKEPTYTESGVQCKVCTECGLELETEEIPMLSESEPPVPQITIGAKTWTTLTRSPSSRIFYNSSVSVSFSGEDALSGVKSIMCIVSGKPLTESELRNSTKWTEGTELRLNKDGTYIVYAKVTDNSGNTSFASTDYIEVDMTTPTSNGIVDGGEYCLEARFTAEDKNLLYVRINGIVATKNDNGTYVIYPSKTSQKIEIIDAAGNLRTFTILVNDSHTYSDYITDRIPSCEENGLRHHECAVCGETDYETIQEFGHDYSASWVVLTEPTCTTSGIEAIICSRCDTVRESREVAPTGHQYVNGKCKICGKETSDTVPYEAVILAVFSCAVAVVIVFWEKRKKKYSK